MFGAVLFDLDGTLLDIDLDAFLKAYFGLLGPVVAALTDDHDPATALGAVIAGTDAMAQPHPGRTNAVVFDEVFKRITGVSLANGHAASVVERFYAEDFPRLKGGAAPAPGAHRALEAARTLGVPVALATNPIFPLPAVRERAAWAEIDLGDFDLVTTYEYSSACKPSADYYTEVAATLGVEPASCLMVGDDAALDLPAADTGMRTFYVGGRPGASADWSGDLNALADLLADGGQR